MPISLMPKAETTKGLLPVESFQEEALSIELCGFVVSAHILSVTIKVCFSRFRCGHTYGASACA